MAYEIQTDTDRIDLRVAHLISNYGPHALCIAREHIHRYRAGGDWHKEQEWLNLYNQILIFTDTSMTQH